MKIRNNGKELELTYNSTTHIIPNGDIEISDDSFAEFILTKAIQWGIDIVKIGDSDKAAVKTIKAIKNEEKETPKTKTTKTKK